MQNDLIYTSCEINSDLQVLVVPRVCQVHLPARERDQKVIEERIFVKFVTSDRELKASREGSK